MSSICHQCAMFGGTRRGTCGAWTLYTKRTQTRTRERAEIIVISRMLLMRAMRGENASLSPWQHIKTSPPPDPSVNLLSVGVLGHASMHAKHPTPTSSTMEKAMSGLGKRGEFQSIQSDQISSLFYGLPTWRNHVGSVHINSPFPQPCIASHGSDPFLLKYSTGREGRAKTKTLRQRE